jgi:hypothetical protein
MIISGTQKGILREGIGQAYTEEELKVVLAEGPELDLERIDRGEDYDTRVANLIKKLEADGKLKEFIQLVVTKKPNSPFLEKIKSEFQEILKEEIKYQGRAAG